MYAMYDVLLTVFSLAMCVIGLHYALLLYWYCCKNRKYYRWSPPPTDAALVEKAQSLLTMTRPTMATVAKALILTEQGAFDTPKAAYHALRVQAAFRGHLARQRLRLKHDAIEEHNRSERAAQVVQRHLRGRSSRIAWQTTLCRTNEIKAASMIQCTFRKRKAGKLLRLSMAAATPPSSPPATPFYQHSEEMVERTTPLTMAVRVTTTTNRWLHPASHWLRAQHARVAPSPHPHHASAHTQQIVHLHHEDISKRADCEPKMRSKEGGMCANTCGSVLNVICRCVKGAGQERGETRTQRRRRMAAEAALKMKRPKFAPLPAILRFPTLEKFVMLTFSPALLTSASSVIGAQVAGTHVLEGWSISLSSLIILGVFGFYFNELRTLLRFRRIHHDMCWQGAEAPESNAEVDDPIFASLGKIGLMVPRLRGRGGYEPPDEDCEEPARTERAIQRAFCCNFWRYCGGMEERAGDVLETLPMWTVCAILSQHHMPPNCACCYPVEAQVARSSAYLLSLGTGRC